MPTTAPRAAWARRRWPSIPRSLSTQELKKRVVLVDANLHVRRPSRFLDLGPDQRSIIDAVTATAIDADVLRRIVVRHDTGVDLLLAPPTPEAADLISGEQHHLLRIVELLRTMYDYVIVDLDERLDDHSSTSSAPPTG